MTAATRGKVLSLYLRVLRVARGWQAHHGRPAGHGGGAGLHSPGGPHPVQTKPADLESIKKCIDECEARIEIGLHYRNPYPRASYLPPMGLATQKGRRFLGQQRLRKQAKPVYLQSHDET
ncbi:LYR motif-containing protein 1 [Merluccius polli]|uniref:LYR motif-containing protein 1 n=1 Tax=Merluccius polli TaxID=89951 RepID=A0AA47MI36_MERPO|nr:LYR motif-containing protein 1 [Merluccius polli]